MEKKKIIYTMSHADEKCVYSCLTYVIACTLLGRIRWARDIARMVHT
jgi:hypothetical protein